MANKLPQQNQGGHQKVLHDQSRPSFVHFLLSCVILLVLMLGNPAYAGEPIIPLWKKPIQAQNLKTAAVAPDGSYVGWIDQGGRIQVYSPKGALVWKNQLQGVNALVLGASNASTIAYSRLNSSDKTVYFLNSKGNLIRKHKHQSTIWSASLDRSGKKAVVGTGSGRIYYYSISKNWASYRRWNAPGVPSTVSCSLDGRYLAAGTWGESGVITYRPNGAFLWRYINENPNLFFDTQVSPSGRLVMSILQPNPGDQMGRILLWSASGKQLLDLNLHAFRIRAMLSQDENVFAVTSTRQITLSKKRVPEQKVTLYHRNGKQIWDKGGLFLRPTLVSIAPNGKWVLCHDNDKSLYLLGSGGKILTKYDLPIRIRTTYTSIDGRIVLVQGVKDQLFLVKVKQ